MKNAKEFVLRVQCPYYDATIMRQNIYHKGNKIKTTVVKSSFLVTLDDNNNVSTSLFITVQKGRRNYVDKEDCNKKKQLPFHCCMMYLHFVTHVHYLYRKAENVNVFKNPKKKLFHFVSICIFLWSPLYQFCFHLLFYFGHFYQPVLKRK